jgi:hypothetical protein
MDLKKHVGIIKNTGTRIAVVYRELPDDKEHCLVIETDRLPDMFAQQINDLVNSSEAKQTNNFFEVLHRRMTPEGENFLLALHNRQLLKKVKVNDVHLYPRPGTPLELSILNQSLNPNKDSAQPVALAQPDNPTLTNSIPIKENEDPALVAKGLIEQAILLEKEALVKRQQAAALAPGLVVHKKPGRPQKSEEEKARIAAERMQKESARQKAARHKEKANKADAALDKKVADAIKKNS